MTTTDERVSRLEGIAESTNDRLNGIDGRLNSIDGRLNNLTTLIITMWVTTILAVIASAIGLGVALK